MATKSLLGLFNYKSVRLGTTNLVHDPSTHYGTKIEVRQENDMLGQRSKVGRSEMGHKRYFYGAIITNI